ncbi:FAD synthase [Anabrus simplex]|uniref:FAD synthase n=1 Tax=Anabrus simplex TaxID=316456 RepID=UPI0035A33A73
MALMKIVSRFLYGMRFTLHTSSRIVEKSDIAKQKSITAGIIVIGNEVLKGQVTDTNSHFIAKNLTELGVKVQKISIIGDDVDIISKEVRFFSDQFTYVLTTGGIGPTHDDLTFEGVAKAFGETTQPHPELVKIIKGLYHNKDITPAALKFAHIPTSAKLTYGYDDIRGKQMLFPNVSVRNVYIFPGVPNLMERLFNSVYKEQFGKGCKQVYKMNLYVSEKEFLITDVLNSIVEKFPNVTFGSYPKYFHSYYDVHITVESEDKKEMEKAYESLRSALPQDSIVDYDLYPLQDSYKKIMRLAEKKGSPYLLNSIRKMEKCYQKYKPEEICVYFACGKESTATLHLAHAYARKNNVDANLRGFHVKSKRILPEGDLYVKETVWRYTIQYEMYEKPFEEAVTKLLRESPHTKAIIFGSPMGDNRSEEEEELLRMAESRSEVEWINVLEGWTALQVWDFVRSLYLPYCCMGSH